MKKIILPLVALSLAACETTTPIQYALFSGSIENTEAKSLTVTGKDFEKEITLRDDGSFADTLFIPKQGYYSFAVEDESSTLFLTIGGSVDLKLNAEEFDESIQYTGNLSAENNILKEVYLINEKFNRSTKAIFSKEETDFLTHLNNQRDTVLQLLNDAKALKSFKEDQKNDALYRHATALSRYQGYHRYFSKNKDFETSSSFLSNQADFELNDSSEYKRSEDYQVLVEMNLSNKADAIFKENGEDSEYIDALLSASEEWPKGVVKDGLLNSWADYILGPNENLTKGYDYLVANTLNHEFKEDYAVTYEKLKKLTKGMPSPEFIDYENHAGGTKSLADLKGKYAYIDVWATWCGPCIGEIPSLKAVEKEFHGKNIEFVSASIDRAKDHDTWINMVNEKELGGTQLMADKAWKSQFVRDYEINGIPRFILIDPEGNIVSADAPRPSDPKLKELFAELNI